MKRLNTFGVRFFIKKARTQNGCAPLFVRITVNKQTSDISLKRRVEVTKWNDLKGKVQVKDENDLQINDYMQQVSNRLYTCREELEKERKLVTAMAVKNRYTGEDEESASLLQLVEYHNTEMKSELEWGTLKNYLTTKKYIAEFLKTKLKRSDIYLTELSYKFVIDFEKFLKSYQPKDHQKPCGQNTAMKHIERLRKMINLAIKIEWLEKDPFAKFSPKFTRTKRGYLTEEELKRIMEKEFSIERLSQVKDLFIFSCFTGLSYAEVYDLESSHVVNGIDGELWIEGQRKKSGEFFAVPLLPQAQEIIEKYRGDVKAEAKGRLLPVLSNQKLNSYLKEIADLCGIEKNMTFHLARHTFATTVTLSKGVPIETVSKMLGHASLRTTQIYAQVVRSKVSNDMRILKEKLVESNSDINRYTA